MLLCDLWMIFFFLATNLIKSFMNNRKTIRTLRDALQYGPREIHKSHPLYSMINEMTSGKWIHFNLKWVIVMRKIREVCDQNRIKTPNMWSFPSQCRTLALLTMHIESFIIFLGNINANYLSLCDGCRVNFVLLLNLTAFFRLSF